MCGFAGIFNTNKLEISEELLRSMGDVISHRGPDDSGTWSSSGIGFVHRRLSIIDISNNGHQPMHSSDGRYSIVFNGEIYNHKEFRNEITSKGIHLKSNSDTEILLYLYILYGEKMLYRLNGMFAFAIWDNYKGELFLCRDRMGVKPLYYHWENNQLTFASEIKSIFKNNINKTPDVNSVQEWLLYRYVAGERTMFKNINKLLPGHFAIFKSDGSSKFERWYHLGKQINNHQPINNPEEWFKETFYSSINYRMVSDVPVGVLLSGGLDSSSVTSALHRNGYHDIQTFTIGFKNYKDDESSIAARYSKELGYKSHIVYLEGNQLLKKLLKSIWHLDEPLAHQNDPQLIAVSEKASEQVKVLLSGEGADELMGGYIRYKTFKFLPYRRAIQTILPLIPKSFKSNRVSKLQQYLNQSTDELIASNACNYYQSDFEEFGINYIGIDNSYRADIIKEAAEYFPTDKVRQLLYHDQHTYLQSLNDRNDRSTMAASIECREPFQDYRLVEGLGTINTKYLLSGKKGKRILVDSMKNELPEYITSFRKVGLSVPWIDLIMQSEELSQLWNGFKKRGIEGVPLFEQFNLPNLVSTIEADKNNRYSTLVLQFFMYFLWQENYLYEVE